MIDSKGNRYDAWCIAWEINGEEYLSHYWVQSTRSLCIKKFMMIWPDKTWRWIKHDRNVCCVKVRLEKV